MPIQGPQPAASDRTMDRKSLNWAQWLHSADYKLREALIKMLRCLGCLQLNFSFPWLCSNCSFNQFNGKGGFIHPASNTFNVPSRIPKVRSAEEGMERCSAHAGIAPGVFWLHHHLRLWLRHGKSGPWLQSSEPRTSWTCQSNAAVAAPQFPSMGAQCWQRDSVLPHLNQQHIQFPQILRSFFQPLIYMIVKACGRAISFCLITPLSAPSVVRSSD